MRQVTVGATSQSVYVIIRDSATGARMTGIAYSASGLIASYTINGGSAVSITLATLAAANSAWSSGGFKEVDATKHPGLYRLDAPNAAFASGASVMFTVTGYSTMEPADEEIQLTAFDLQATIASIMTTAMTEAYAANGAAPTPAQMLFMIWSRLAEASISSVTETTKKLDHSTTAMTFTLNDATNPSSITRAS